MKSSSTSFRVFLSVLAAMLAVQPAAGQEPGQIAACLGSITPKGQPAAVTYNVNDPTPFVVSYTYNSTACLVPTTIPVYRIFLTDDDLGQDYQCPVVQFDNTGKFSVTCQTTKGFIGTAAQNGDTDWYSGVKIGNRSQGYTVLTAFEVSADDSPYSAPSQAAQRRRQYEHDYKKRHGIPPPPQAGGQSQLTVPQEPLQPKFICGKGASYCYTGKRLGYECIDTSTDVLSCGGCPLSASKVDCSEIVGASNVECRASACHVVSCDAYHSPSTDRKSCVPNGLSKKRSILSF